MCIRVFNVGRVRSLFWSYISLTFVGFVHFLDLYKFDLGWVRPLCGLISLTLVGFVHFVDRVDPWWDPSTLWTCKFDPGWVRPLCGLISLTLGGIRPLCGNNLNRNDTSWS